MGYVAKVPPPREMQVVLVKKKRRVVVDDEPEQAEPRNGKITIARTIKRSAMPKGRAPGVRNPEYEKLVRRLIRIAAEDEAVIIPVASKVEKVRIREGVRKPLRVRGYTLEAVTDYDDELGEVLILCAVPRDSEEPDEEEEEVENAVEETEDEEEDDEEEVVVPVRRKKVRR
jgi:hypothetical protein